MTAAFDQESVHFINRTEIIQAAINDIEDPVKRAECQAKFNDNAEHVFNLFAFNGRFRSRSFASLMKTSEKQSVDPDRLKRWIEIAKVLLPFILALL